jgi:hypothetical protein
MGGKIAEVVLVGQAQRDGIDQCSCHLDFDQCLQDDMPLLTANWLVSNIFWPAATVIDSARQAA